MQLLTIHKDCDEGVSKQIGNPNKRDNGWANLRKESEKRKLW